MSESEDTSIEEPSSSAFDRSFVYPAMHVENTRNTIYSGTSNIGKYTEAKIWEKEIHVSRYYLCAAVPGFSNQKTYINVKKLVALVLL